MRIKLFQSNNKESLDAFIFFLKKKNAKYGQRVVYKLMYKIVVVLALYY